MANVVLASEAHDMPPKAVQKNDSTPLRDYIGDVDPRAGIAFVVVKPDIGGGLTGSVVRQGYIGLKGSDLLFPSIGVTNAWRPVMTMSAAPDSDVRRPG